MIPVACDLDFGDAIVEDFDEKDAVATHVVVLVPDLKLVRIQKALD